MSSLIQSSSTYILIAFQKLSNIFCEHRNERQTEMLDVCPHKASNQDSSKRTLKMKGRSKKDPAQNPQIISCQSFHLFCQLIQAHRRWKSTQTLTVSAVSCLWVQRLYRELWRQNSHQTRRQSQTIKMKFNLKKFHMNNWYSPPKPKGSQLYKDLPPANSRSRRSCNIKQAIALLLLLPPSHFSRVRLCATP